MLNPAECLGQDKKNGMYLRGSSFKYIYFRDSDLAIQSWPGSGEHLKLGDS